MPIDGNHRNICRFTGEDDPRIAPVISNIRHMFREIRVDYMAGSKNKQSTANSQSNNPISGMNAYSFYLQPSPLGHEDKSRRL